MLEAMFQTQCAGCGAPGATLCRTCRFALVARHPSAHRTGTASGEVLVAAPFTGRVRDVLLGFKYGNRRAVAAHLGGLLVNRLVAGGVSGPSIDVVTWAPTSARRRRGRGFDQAELVARQVARQLGVPCRRLLDRTSPEDPQTGRSRAQRLHGPTFRAHPNVAAGRRILLVDDVVTTGATLRSAAAVLERAGAHDVIQAAIAATPDRRSDLAAGVHERPPPPTSPGGRRRVVRGPRAA